ncbi:MAG: hypothetical protein DRN21_01435 [Thermoplasmata archaeon]|nr:MAG: hypothetical protein DRN21_01435 [Thermoplasmata archaeon]
MYKKVSILVVLILFLPVANNLSFEKEQHEAPLYEAEMQESPAVAAASASTSQRHVLAELGSTSWCPSCPRATETIKKVYESGDLPFYYMTLVYDLNDVAQWRGRQFSDAYIPMLYIDGGYLVVDSVTEFSYTKAIEDALERDVHDVALAMQAEWRGNAISITLDVTNGGNSPYFGNVRVCVMEVNSRWQNQAGDNYSYAFMDYALNTYAFIGGGDTKSYTITWDNTQQMEQGNTMILAYAANWLPHLQKNPWEQPKPVRFLAQFVDNACAVEI